MSKGCIIRVEDVRREFKRKIEEEGEVLGRNFLRVDSFLNHQIDPVFVDKVGQVLAGQYKEKRPTKVVTAEAGGNIISYASARHLNDFYEYDVSVVHAKKGVPKTMRNPIIQKIESPTKEEVTELALSGEYLGEDDRVLLVDDFLYTGLTSEALTKLVEKAGASLIGYAFVISKRNFGGYERISKYEHPIFILIEIEKLDPESGKVFFA